MAISKLQASLAEVTNDVTVAAAKINFDFTLIKCEAPKEYQELGNVLSGSRKAKAELGSAHITARKLGALFEGLYPATPKLIKAYGLRASEIAATAKQACSDSEKGMFAAYTGADGTAIWAAATSSSAALHVQLLACMLARVWTAPEAISIWVELVEQRRKNIVTHFDEGEEMPFATLTAATQSPIPRSSLAEWDNNARAWLRTADRIKIKEQKQLMLIIDNVKISIERSGTLLSSVLSAWRLALSTMESLISGMPQAVNNGSALFGLSSWHIYPDILVHGETSAEVRFGDPLASAGGTLTMGLDRPRYNDTPGIHWSLSLAHLAFYGPPVSSEARLNHDSTKISFPQFAQAVLGCLLGQWKLSKNQLEIHARIFLSILESARRVADNDVNPNRPFFTATNFLQNPYHWINVMGQAARCFLDKCHPEKDACDKLVNLGLRRSFQFIPGKGSHPFFGLFNADIIMRCLKGSEERVAWLRHVVSLNKINPSHSAFIQYIDDSGEVRRSQLATALPVPQHKRKRSQSSEESRPCMNHLRWLVPGPNRAFPGEKVVNQSFWIGIDALNEKLYCGLDSKHPPMQIYTKVYGDFNLAAIVQGTNAPTATFRLPTAEDVLWCLDHDLFSIGTLISTIDRLLEQYKMISKTMVAIMAAAKTYKDLPNATVPVTTLNHCISETKWASALNTEIFIYNTHGPMWSSQLLTSNDNLSNPRGIIFSCIAFMEAGIDIDPNSLKKVMAIAYEDSLYVSMQLISDPWHSITETGLRMVLGSLGRPGLTLMVPPQNPIVRQVDPASWRVVGHNEFNGYDEDHFGRTSLHLSFTGYCAPVYQGEHNQDSQAHFLESVVSIYDTGSWVGDIDILKVLSTGALYRLPPKSCDHQCRGNLGQEIVSAESWDEILDSPRESFVVRAHGNWAARLAAVALLGQISPPELLKNGIGVCPRDICWTCFHDSRFRSGSDLRRVYVF